MNSDFLRLIAVAQGVACMLGVIALGISTGSKWGPALAIVSLGLAYLATTAFLEPDPPEYKLGNLISLASAVVGFLSIMVVVL